MSTLVREDPKPCSEKSLHKSIDGPQHAAKSCGGDVLGGQEGVEEVECGCERQDIPGYVAQATGSRTFEAMGGNGITDLFDGEVGDLEFVAISVQHLPIAFVKNYVRVDGREGC